MSHEHHSLFRNYGFNIRKYELNIRKSEFNIRKYEQKLEKYFSFENRTWSQSNVMELANKFETWRECKKKQIYFLFATQKNSRHFVYVGNSNETIVLSGE